MPVQVQNDLPTFAARSRRGSRVCEHCGANRMVKDFGLVWHKGIKTDRRLAVCRPCVRRYITGIEAGAGPTSASPGARPGAPLGPVAQAAVGRAQQLAVEEGWTVIDAEDYLALVPPDGLSDRAPKAFKLRGVPTTAQWRSKLDELRAHSPAGARLADLIEGREPAPPPAPPPERLGPDEALVEAFAARYELDLGALFDAFALGGAAACDEFLRQLVEGPAPGTAASELARRLESRLGAPPEERRPDEFYAALAVKAYNHHRRGTVPQLLSYVPGVERFPAVAGAA